MMEQEKERTASTAAKEEQKAEWGPEQDTLLRDLVATHGTKDWAHVVDAFNVSLPRGHKTAKQCAARWEDLQDGDSSKKAWSEQDELGMLVAHKQHKNRWADVSEALKGRSNNTIKNKFYSVFRKIRGKILKSDCSYVSKLELLEIHYIISLIEQYLAHPALTPKTKGKRGKDFIYSLIHSLNDKMVADYKAKITELTKSEGTMEELFVKLTTQLQMPLDQPAEPVASPSVSPLPVPVPVPAATVDQPVRPAMPIEIHKDEFAEPICPSKAMCDPVKLDEDKIAPFQHEPVQDISPLFGNMPPFSPSILFSPTTLSVGPAAVAATKGACFGTDFSEMSTVMRGFNEKGFDPAHMAVRPGYPMPARPASGHWSEGLQLIFQQMQTPQSTAGSSSSHPQCGDITQGQ